MILDRPSLVFTLVHGTFARGAAWTKDQSAVREALSRGSRTPPTFLAFECGYNTNKARIAAGRALAEHIRKASANYPGARHIVVAHSHGGNVALYALRDTPKPHPELITLATPFIHGSPRAIENFLGFLERILLYVIGVTILFLIALVIELLVQGTIGAWLIGPCRVLSAVCEGLQPLKGAEGHRTWDFVFVGIFLMWFVVGIPHLRVVIDIISSKFQAAYETLFKRACDACDRLTPTLPADGSLLAIYVDADEPYGGLRLVDFLGAIPIKIVTSVIAGIGAFFAAPSILGKILKGVYAALQDIGLGTDIQNVILVALIVLFLLFPFFCLILSLLVLFVIIRRIGYWDERLAESLLVELSVSSFPNVSWDARDRGEVAPRAGSCKYHFAKSLLWKFRGQLRHSHVYLDAQILNDLTAYVADRVRPGGFEPFSLPRFDIDLDPDRLSRKDSGGIN
jgi:hypothetical protein